MKNVFVTCILLSCVCLSVGTIILVKRQPRIAVIDLDRLITKLSQPLAAQYPQGNVPKRVLVDLIESVRGDLETFAKKRNVHLLAKQACFSEAKDLTEAFLQEMHYDRDQEDD